MLLLVDVVVAIVIDLLVSFSGDVSTLDGGVVLRIIVEMVLEKVKQNYAIGCDEQMVDVGNKIKGKRQYIHICIISRSRRRETDYRRANG